MSDLFQRRGWTPLPFIAKELPYAPRLHWLGIALILITVSMAGLTIAGFTAHGSVGAAGRWLLRNPAAGAGPDAACALRARAR